jgi:hypothetical protein
MKNKTSWVAAAALSGLPLLGVAQVDPADTGAIVPALVYRSAFSDYKPWQDIPPADWRAVNDTVRDAKPGGQRDQGLASSRTAPGASPAPAAPAAAAGGGHSGHHGARP